MYITNAATGLFALDIFEHATRVHACPHHPARGLGLRRSEERVIGGLGVDAPQVSAIELQRGWRGREQEGREAGVVVSKRGARRSVDWR